MKTQKKKKADERTPAEDSHPVQRMLARLAGETADQRARTWAENWLLHGEWIAVPLTARQ